MSPTDSGRISGTFWRKNTAWFDPLNIFLSAILGPGPVAQPTAVDHETQTR